MGVKNLWDILESCKQTLPLHHLQNKRLCVDISCWLVQLHNATKSHAGSRDKAYLRSLFYRLRALIALNCSLIFVTDGSIPSIKLSTYRRRLGVVSEVTREEANSQPMHSLRRNMGSEFSCMIKDAKALGFALGIPCLDGLEEAEAQCALLNSESMCDGCFSTDSDIFLFGAKTVYREIILDGGYVVCYEMADIERKLGFGRNSLIALALLLGGDYSQGVRGYGQETACRLVKSIGDDKILQKVKSEGLAFARKSKMTKKTVKDLNCGNNKENDPCYTQCTIEGQNTGSDDELRQVINAYMKPKCHLPDSEAMQRACSQHSFIRPQLQQICAQFFDWSPDKTDEYILPKIAERDLRRFANLRSTSSKLGAHIPLDKMPVPCPVSAIVKPRKVQGIDYFEVSWQGVEGLQTSVVPADLIESACPEKIAEFMEKKCEAKKKQNRRPRPRKSAKADVGEVDTQLKALMLDLESQSNTVADTTMHHGLNVLHNIVGNEAFIDLSSPSPPLRACKLVRRQSSRDTPADVIDICKPETARVDVIDICESETDASPEHERKARELRSFIKSIREDLC